MNESDIIRLRLEEPYRIVCVSDIHGNYTKLKSLMEKVDLRERDILLFLGDLVEKGPRSADTLDYLMGLSSRPNTYFIKGNLDRRICEASQDPEAFLEYHRRRPENTIAQYARREGWEQINEQNAAEALTAALQKYAPSFQFLNSLRVAVDAGDFLFAHAGIEERPDWENGDPANSIRNQTFFLMGRNLTDKWVVVGHFPACNLNEMGITDLPEISHERRIIGIDGGCGPKRFCQLNALSIEKAGGGISFQSYFALDDPLVAVREAYTPVAGLPYMRNQWIDHEEKLIPLERGPHFTLCRKQGNGTVGLVKNELMAVKGDYAVYINDHTSYHLPVRAGERVYVLDRTCSGFAYVKNEAGEGGWIPHSCL